MLIPGDFGGLSMTLPDDEFVTFNDIQQQMKLSRYLLKELMKKPGFPAHLDISARAKRWRKKEIERWTGKRFTKI